jgi:hypothetical protein
VEILRTVSETEDADGDGETCWSLPVDTDRESGEMIPGLPESLKMSTLERREIRQTWSHLDS